MPRVVLDESAIHAAIREKIAEYGSAIVKEVSTAIANHKVVVVGMRQNPYPRRARKLLNQKSIDFEYLEFGSYLSGWRRRTALKLWTGWPTFPMIFVKGQLIGGFSDLQTLMQSGEFERMMR